MSACGVGIIFVLGFQVGVVVMMLIYGVINR